MAARKRIGANRKEATEYFNLSPQGFSDWDKKGWVVRHSDRSIDIEATKIRVDANRDPFVGGKADRGPEPKPKLAGNPGAGAGGRAGADDDPDNDDDEIDFAEAKRLEKIEDARYKALRNERLEGSLIPRDMVIEIFSDALAAVRESLSALPVRWRHKLVGMNTDELDRTIRSEVDSVLKEIRDALDPKQIIGSDESGDMEGSED